jgi:hypothetical protein
METKMIEQHNLKIFRAKIDTFVEKICKSFPENTIEITGQPFPEFKFTYIVNCSNCSNCSNEKKDRIEKKARIRCDLKKVKDQTTRCYIDFIERILFGEKLMIFIDDSDARENEDIPLFSLNEMKFIIERLHFKPKPAN